MNERQRNNVETLINSINDDLAANKNELENLKLQIKDVDSSYTSLTSQNRRNESKISEYSILFKKLRIDETQIKNQYDETIQDLENKIES